jgi:hypothetical protein
MDRRTFKTTVLFFSVFASLGLSACNDTGFSASDLGQKELDKLNPTINPSPTPTTTPTPLPTPTTCPVVDCAAPPSGCLYVDPVFTNGCKTSCGTLKCTTPSPTPVPTVTPTPSPTPKVTPTPTPTPTVTPSSTPIYKAGADKFNVPAADTAKVDMLFCVDNSGSMADKQQVLADSVNTFIGLFVTGGVDFHIGIVTTDTENTDAKYWSDRLVGYVTPNRGRLLSKYTEKFLTKNSTSVTDKMKANAKVGTSGSGDEQCFGSMLYALDDTMLSSGNYNEGFVRDDALLSMIVISDEDEDIKNGEGVAGRIARMKTRVATIKGPNSRGYSFDFVINKTAAKPSTSITYPLPSGTNFYPNFYLAAADAFVAKTYDVLKNFGSDLATIGSNIVIQAQSSFKLSNKPNPVASIVVKLDGKIVAADPIDGYVYDASNNTISLKGAALQASPGASLTIDYTY